MWLGDRGADLGAAADDTAGGGRVEVDRWGLLARRQRLACPIDLHREGRDVDGQPRVGAGPDPGGVAVDAGELKRRQLDSSHDAKCTQRALESPEEIFVLRGTGIQHATVRGDNLELEDTVADPTSLS